MSDGIFLAPYPVLNFNPFTQTPERKVAFQSTYPSGPVNASPTNATTTVIKSTVMTNQRLEDAAALELKSQKLKDRYKEKEEQKAIAAEEVDYIKNGQKCLLVGGLLFVFLALAAAAVSFATPEWRIYDVNNPNIIITYLNQNPSLNICSRSTATSVCQFFTSRVRGLFVTCYSDDTFFSSVYTSDQRASSWLNGYKCVWEQKYNLQSTPITINDNCDQDTGINNGRIMAQANTNIMRTQWLAFACAIICLLLGFLLSIISFKEFRVTGSMCAGVFLLFAVILLLIGMVLFHVYIYMEEETLRCPPFYGTMKKDSYSVVYGNTRAYFGFSFYLGWSSFAIAILGCAFILAAACQRRRAQMQIDKAMYRLDQINKEERVEKKFEEMEAKKWRKEMENPIKQTTNQPKPAKVGMSGILNKSIKRSEASVSDSEIDYEIKALKKNKEARLRILRDEAEDQIEYERSKIKASEKKKSEELKRAQRDLEEVERQIKMLEIKKKKYERKKPTHSDDESTIDDDSDEEVKIRSQKKKKIQRSRSMESIDEGKCGKVVKAAEYRQQSCCDPYTLHLPTGFNPPPYRP